MPVLIKRGLVIEYTDDGAGPVVVLLHSSVSGNRQWRAFIDAFADRYRVLAINLYGYGATTPWPAADVQTLAAQADLVLAICANIAGPIHLVGHSFGGSVALKAAAALEGRLGRLVLLEPIPFYLLEQHGRREAHAEARALRDYVKEHGAHGEWTRVAERFADYWVVEGTWAAMSEKRRATFVMSMPPNAHEWDAIDHETTRIEVWGRLGADVLVIFARDTRRSVREIVELFQHACPHWSFAEIPEGGHMAPLSRPDLVHPIIGRFLAGTHA
jgi:pimeloyl-ACP methyl ester carboxylesterase